MSNYLIVKGSLIVGDTLNRYDLNGGAQMIQLHRMTFGFIERVSRAFLGFMILIISFTFAISTETFATMHLVAMYPLLTALVAWDPVYLVIELLRERYIEYTMFH